MESFRILLVEDSIASAFIYEEQIHRRDPDMRVHLAKSFQEAWDDAAVFRPHLIILDINLPDSREEETIARIGQLALRVGEGKRCCILAMSVDPSLRQLALDAGADDFMQKLMGEGAQALMDRINTLSEKCSCLYI